MTDLNIDKLENEAMARAYDTTKPDELMENKKEIKIEKHNNQFFNISKLINNNFEIEQEQFLQCFRCLKMIDCDWWCHYALLLNHKFGMLIPSDYIIIYDKSSSNTLNQGRIQFKKDKEYFVEYDLSSKEEFEAYMAELRVISSCTDNFENNNIKFYEFENGYIYMYYEGYIWKISGYSRNNIKEYYDMYLILMSIRTINNNSYNYNDKNNLKLLYLISKNALDYLYHGIDLKKKRIDEINEYSLNEDVVTFSIENSRYLTVIDEAYQLFKRSTMNNSDDIEKIQIYHHDDNWYFEGTFKAGILGIYNSGHVLDFPEIVNSNELNEIEKRDLLENIINQKQIELYEYKDIISQKIVDNLIFDLKENLTFKQWHELEIVNYLRIEDIDMENKTDELLYNFLKFNLDNGHNDIIRKIIDIEYLSSKIKPINIVIGPEFIAFACNIIAQNKTFILFENNELIEWK